jgi:hypothetical protein
MAFDGYPRFSFDGGTPPARTHEGIAEAAEVAENHLRVRRSPDHFSAETRGVIGHSPLLDLGYFDIWRMTILDPMHLIPGVIGRHLFRMMSGKVLKAHAAKAKTQAQADQTKENDRIEKEIARKQQTYERKLEAWEKRRSLTARKYRGSARLAVQLGQMPPKPQPPDNGLIVVDPIVPAAAAAASPAEVSFTITCLVTLVSLLLM